MSGDTGSWPHQRLLALDWLAHGSAAVPFVDDLLPRVCELLLADGVPVERGALHLQALHPQFMGARLLWRTGLKQAEMALVGFEIVGEERYLNSPIRALWFGAEGIRQRLDLAETSSGFAIYDELRADGFTDYVALPMVFTDGRRHACTWSTRRPGGFTTAQLIALNDLLPVLAMATEIRLNRRIARTVLETYVGKSAAPRILAGEIRRGSGETVRAAIWNSDIRGFTQLSERWPRDDVISGLNDYFDAMVEPVERHGGEVLKFLGDGVLAIFPLDEAAACSRALSGAFEACKAMIGLNERRRGEGRFELEYGIALHMGDVMYGNVGSRRRLDFTVIGPAVNVSARMQQLCRETGRSVLISQPFAMSCGCSLEALEPLGAFPIRGVEGPLEVFALAGGA
ncbi:adenylate/guanylate cyclase domain-containing protein [Geminicoccaceae bacterium 1502E]|nr:adenylate/guanylate cyclase domain-containing protein [Geminicoccaceae bacterium 1502E]